MSATHCDQARSQHAFFGRPRKGRAARTAILIGLALLAIGASIAPGIASAQTEAEINITHAPDRSTAVSPGEVVRFTVSVQSAEDADIDGISVRIDYDEAVFPTVEADLPSGVEDDGDVLEWALEEPLSPEDTASLTYRATAAGAFPTGLAAVENDAQLLIDGERISSAVATVPLAAPTPTVQEQSRTVTELEANDLLLLLLALLIPAFLVVLFVTGLSYKALDKDDADGRWVSSTTTILNLLAVVVIVLAVLILAIRGSIGEDGVISILSGIAGYVLGRATTKGN